MSWPSTSDPARGRRDDAADDADQRRLAGAVRAEQREDLALADLEVDALQRLQARGVGLGQAGNGDDRRHRREGSAVHYFADSSRTARTSMLPTLAGGIFAAICDGVVEVLGVDQVEPGELLLRFGEGAVGQRHLAVADTHGRGRRHSLQGFRGDVTAALPKRLPVGEAFAVGHGRQRLLRHVDQAQVFHVALFNRVGSGERAERLARPPRSAAPRPTRATPPGSSPRPGSPPPCPSPR